MKIHILQVPETLVENAESSSDLVEKPTDYSNDDVVQMWVYSLNAVVNHWSKLKPFFWHFILTKIHFYYANQYDKINITDSLVIQSIAMKTARTKE